MFDSLGKISFWKTVLIHIIFSISSGVILYFIFGEQSDKNFTIVYISNLIVNILILYWIYTKIKKDNISLKEPLLTLKSDFHILETIFILLFRFIFTIGSFFILIHIIFKYYPDKLVGFVDNDYFGAKNSLELVLFFITASIIAPIFEEIVFRGIFLTRISQKFGYGVGIFASSLLFGVLHMDGAIIGAFIFGVLLSIIYLKYKNILVNILIHGINNFIPTILFVFQKDEKIGNGSGELLSQMGLEGGDSSPFLGGGIFFILISIWYIIYFCIKNWPRKLLK